MSVTNNMMSFIKGMAKAKRILNAYVYKAFEETIIELLEDADRRYDSEFPMLTGNLKTGYVGALYVDDVRKEVFNYNDLGIIDPMTGMVVPGPTLAFKRYGSDYANDWVTYVSDYRESSPFEWQKTQKGQYAYRLAETFTARRNTKRMVNGFTILIVNGAPYASFMEQERNLNVLTETSEVAERIFLSKITKIPYLSRR